MRIADAVILLIPATADLGGDHWLARWEAKLSTGQVVAPDAAADAWREAIVAAVREAPRPVVLVAHGAGVFAMMRALPGFTPGKVRGAFLVAPSAPDAPLPTDPLPFPSAVVASRDHPEMDYAAVEDLAYAWGGRLLDAGAAGAIDAASGHGPWPEGLMSFAGFLRTI